MNKFNLFFLLAFQLLTLFSYSQKKTNTQKVVVDMLDGTETIYHAENIFFTIDSNFYLTLDKGSFLFNRTPFVYKISKARIKNLSDFYPYKEYKRSNMIWFGVSLVTRRLFGVLFSIIGPAIMHYLVIEEDYVTEGVTIGSVITGGGVLLLVGTKKQREKELHFNLWRNSRKIKP